MTEQERLQRNSIDINGLSPCDRDRIEEVGFDRWLDGHHRARLLLEFCDNIGIEGSA
jgi:hypothetical protein